MRGRVRDGEMKRWRMRREGTIRGGFRDEDDGCGVCL